MPEPWKKTQPRGNPISRRTNKPRSENKPAINPIKKRIRDLNRLLEHKETLPADVRLNYERELASCKHDVENAQRAINRSRMIQKYHMVRFFERKKATKLLKRARTRLANAETPEEQQLQQDAVHAYEVDLNYTLYHPLHMVYTSLYADTKKTKEPEAASGTKRDRVMWRVVEQAMASGRLQDLREGKLEGYRDTTPSPSEGMGKNAGKDAVKKKAKEVSRGSSLAVDKTAQNSQNAENKNGHDKNNDDDDDDDDTGAAFFE